MKIIYETPYGSHLYGTSMPSSDKDFVRIYVPEYRDLLLQKSSATKSSHVILSDFDVSVHPVAKIARDAASGNFTAIEILYSTMVQHKPGHKINRHWLKLYLNRHSFLTKSSASFLGYARSQSKKYDVRGEKLNVVDKLLQKMGEMTSAELKGFISDDPRMLAEFKKVGEEYTNVHPIAQTSGTTVDHLSICGKKIPLTGNWHLVLDTLKNLKEGYGKRTAEAARTSGIDWKGMMYAVRIAQEAIEYFNTGEIVFPRPNAEFLKEIRNGNKPYEEVSALIDKLLIDAEGAAVLSNLREEPNIDALDNLLLEIYEENK